MGRIMLKRHSGVAIFLHWFNAVCWFFLLITGLGLIDNKELQPLGMWLPKALQGLFGSSENLLVAHEICGFTWAGVLLVFALIFAKTVTIPFLKQIFSFSIKNDALWLIKKGIQMTMGYKVLARLGFEPKIPDQGFYNVGQKLFAIPAVLGGIVIAITGIIMTLSKIYFNDPTLVQWSILIHFITVGLVFAGLLIHIFMASIAKGELPALISMFTGSVPEEYAKHHHKFWYDEIVPERGQNSTAGRN